jgi:hypothetical protein
MKQVEEFVINMAAVELYTFLCEHQTCPISSNSQRALIGILNHCITNYHENIYVVDFRKMGMAAEDSTV